MDDEFDVEVCWIEVRIVMFHHCGALQQQLFSPELLRPARWVASWVGQRRVADQR